MLENKNMIPVGTTDYYGKEAIIRDYVLKKIEEIYKKYGFESLYTPIFENGEVFKGHHGEGEKLLFKLKDKNNNDYVLKYDSTVPLARVVSMYNDIKLPYKRYQLQQSYRDDEIDKGHFREFVQCDGDVVGSYSLVDDAEFVSIAYDGLNSIGFKDFTIRLNHRKIIKAIAEKANIYDDDDGVLLVQRAIDVADKINKGNVEDVRVELSKTNIPLNVIDIIIELINLTNSSLNVVNTLDIIEKYFKGNKNAQDGINDLKEIISLLDVNVIKKVKIDFTLARGADYYTGFIIEAVINKIKLGAVLGGGRYDNLVEAFSNKKIPAVGLAFGMERLIVAMKELNLEKLALNSNERKILIYVTDELKKQSIELANKLREKYSVSIVSENDLSFENILEYSEACNISLITKIYPDGSYQFYKIDEIEKMEKEFNKGKLKVLTNPE